MNILKPVSTSQEIKIIPRKYIEVVDVYVTDSNTREEVVYNNVTTTISFGYMNFSMVYTKLKNNRFYTIRIKNADEVLYSGQLFVTDQTDLDEFELTKDVYKTSNDTDGVIYID